LEVDGLKEEEEEEEEDDADAIGNNYLSRRSEV
jgi:hypothetical protein